VKKSNKKNPLPTGKGFYIKGAIIGDFKDSSLATAEKQDIRRLPLLYSMQKSFNR